ncbi:unnamed protein product [Rotaria sp. Silwood1]|nr:unnamed protein product [Rotaria sp. Silwood1]CAF1585291.1 unnamed protein product [Rotaria sp. Silwood1]CAF3663950.1 unnamed protein product [Rotaria sp. Silwood1]CAF4738687.1 unnamed protein product [Rotaria sp. Silwood1]CAF4741742.1 unnamed protein product [Rotaria sp. Silwood1]
MSTTIFPDIYRHIARKSTVSRNVNVPSKTLPLCNSTSIHDNNNKEEKIIFDQIQYDYKLEKNLQQQKQSFVILPDNEIEQMIVEQTNEEIIKDILEQIQKQISNDFSNEKQIILTDIHNCIDSLLNHFDANINESISTTHDVQMEDITRSLNEQISMESDEPSSILSQSQTDDDFIEGEESTSNTNEHLCACQCHQIATNSIIINPTNEYLLFEQALKQTRQEEQQKQSINNNHLVQTLKLQHQDLINFYHKQINLNKIDREQQTNQINQHDSQIQTDLTPIQQQQQQNPKSNIYVYVNGINSVPIPKVIPATTLRPFNSFLTPIRTTGPSLQQLIPCLTTTNTATTITLTNKTSIVKKVMSIPTINSHPSPPVTTSTSATSHDIVDLTEEDDDNNTNKLSTEKISSTKLEQNSILSTATAVRIQPVNRPMGSNTTIPVGQTLVLRPLPENNPFDNTIARPQLSITHDNTTVRLTWNLPSTPMESIQNYEIYAYKQNATTSLSDWKKIGIVKSMRLPMAVTLKEFQCNCHYAFAVRAISINNSFGPFCEPKIIFTGNTLVEPLIPVKYSI